MKSIETFDLFIECKPEPKARPRVGKFGNVYTPRQTAAYENLLRLYIKNKFMTGPLRVEIGIFLLKPKTSKNKFPVVKPDIDNYVKAVLDAMNGFLFKDDCQVVELYAYKQYSVKQGVFIKVHSYEDFS
ncbi:RusA family crossover junction endodeoxyribonuclease [Candidatus Saccharibacteria bacterium]|nr:MAG: RusA family crossover junction endodeoxyribonuclease [Candidatus Saccharibacteria bacterium]